MLLQFQTLFSYHRGQIPHAKGLVGCVKNLTFSSGHGGKKYLYDLGNPASGENYADHCDKARWLNFEFGGRISFEGFFPVHIVLIQRLGYKKICSLNLRLL